MMRVLTNRVGECLRRMENYILRSLDIVHPALAVDLRIPTHNLENTRPKPISSVGDVKSMIDEIFDGFFQAAVPKHRRSRERRATRKFGEFKLMKYMTPRQNLVACLECGTWHESHTICGKCYEKVKRETEEMRAKIDPDIRQYDVPQSEVVYLYKGEEDERQKHNGKYIVEMEKPRPEWFPKNLLTPRHGK